ncbi:MAG TPA: HNH endonuclease [Chloroflexota bacterium]|nr:HNH endonuclease [Chloroflexota bacterium]
MKRKATPAIDRLLRRTDLLIANEGCWEWVGAKNSKGYGSINSGGGSTSTHRLAYQEFVGPIPDDLCVLHKCDNPPCWRPSHLFVGTRLDNAKDRDLKGRFRSTPVRGERHHTSKTTDAQVVEAKRRVASGERQASVAKSLGVARPTVHMWVHGRVRNGERQG